MHRVILMLVIAFALLAQFCCSGGGDDESDSSSENSQSSTTIAQAGGNSAPRRGNAGSGGDNADVDIVGVYRYGSDVLGGGSESGSVRITKLGDAYDVLMSPTGRNEYPGIGIRNGDHFAVCYSLSLPGERGVGSFTINADGTLTGHWAVLGSDGQLLEDTWQKVE